MPHFPPRLVSRLRSFRKRLPLRLLSVYPPFVGAGVRVRSVAPDLSRFDVEMKLRWWNRNYVGTHFGGSLYSMCDPFFMLILMNQLGREYIVWDKAATIRFRRPGRGRVTARFEILPEQVAAVRAQVAQDGVVEPLFEVQVVDESGETVAEIEKRLYVRRKVPNREGEDSAARES